MTTRTTPAATRRSAPPVLIGLALLAAAVFVVRGVRTALGDGVPDTEQTGLAAGAALAGLAALLSILGAVLATRGRIAAVPLGVTLLLELLVLDRWVAPPRLVTSIPLVFAIALALVPPTRRAPPRPTSGAHAAAVVLALVLMVPIGFFYFSTGLVAPAPDVFGAYALFGFLVVVTVVLARRRSWWVLAMPPVSAGLWFLMLWLGETYLDWQP